MVAFILTVVHLDQPFQTIQRPKDLPSDIRFLGKHTDPTDTDSETLLGEFGPTIQTNQDISSHASTMDKAKHSKKLEKFWK